MFDDRIDTFDSRRSSGLLTVSVLISHQSELYAATYALHERQAGTRPQSRSSKRIYRATILTVQPFGKAAKTT